MIGILIIDDSMHASFSIKWLLMVGRWFIFQDEHLPYGIKSLAYCVQEIPAHRINPSINFMFVPIWTVIITELKVFEKQNQYLNMTVQIKANIKLMDGWIAYRGQVIWFPSVYGMGSVLRFVPDQNKRLIPHSTLSIIALDLNLSKCWFLNLENRINIAIQI